jgi:hypothetical protein
MGPPPRYALGQMLAFPRMRQPWRTSNSQVDLQASAAGSADHPARFESAISSPGHLLIAIKPGVCQSKRSGNCPTLETQPRPSIGRPRPQAADLGRPAQDPPWLVPFVNRFDSGWVSGIKGKENQQSLPVLTPVELTKVS